MEDLTLGSEIKTWNKKAEPPHLKRNGTFVGEWFIFKHYQ